jgi:hypothetical protein
MGGLFVIPQQGVEWGAAVSGHAAAPLSSVMNSRLFN